MKLGIVSDLHCNIDGLDRASETMGPIEALLCLGDSAVLDTASEEIVVRDFPARLPSENEDRTAGAG